MKKSKISVLLIAGAFVGCALQSKEPTGSLIRARGLQQVVARTDASKLAAAEVQQGDELLAGAERVHERDPRSNMEYHLANLAAAKYEIAMADARRQKADEQYVMIIRQESEEKVAKREPGEEAPELEPGEGVEFEKTPEGSKVTVTGAVLFRIDESELLPIARERLQRVARTLKEGKGAITVEGHADATGSEEHNDTLSQARAESVKQFLVEQGIPAERITAVGRGEREPIATNKTPDGRANNRRVELQIDEA